jgi:hypothetical protein
VPGQVIKGASQVLSDVANERRELGRYFLMNPKIVGSLALLRIVLGNDFVGVRRTKKPIDFELKIDEVLVGPIDFYQ